MDSATVLTWAGVFFFHLVVLSWTVGNHVAAVSCEWR